MIRFRTLLSYGLAVGAAAGLVAASFSIARSNAQQEISADRVVAIEPESPREVGALGTVQPAGSVIVLSAPMGGVITALPFVPGDTVDAGTILVRMDDAVAQAKLKELRLAVFLAEARLAEAQGGIPSLRADLAVARAVLLATEAQLDDAAEELATAEQLSKTSTSIAQRELGRRKTALRIADAKVEEASARVARAEAELAALDPVGGSKLQPLVQDIESARAAVVSAEAELAQLTVTSPIAGEVLDVELQSGEYAPLGGEILSIGAAGPREVRAEIAEADISLLDPAGKAWGAVRGSGDERFPLTFIRREPLVKPKTTLSGNVSESVDTRVAQVIFRAPAGADLMVGQVIDVLIEVGR